MAKINPGQLVMYTTIVLAIFAVLFSVMFQRTDSIALGLGVALIGYGFKLPTGYSLLLSSLAVFLSAYLPFGESSVAIIQGFKEGFSAEEAFEEEEGFEEGEEEGFEDEAKEAFEEEEEGFEEGEEEGFEDEAKEAFEEEEGFSDSDSEGFGESDTEGFVSAEFDSKDTFEGFANAAPEKKKKKRVPPPDHGSRAEKFELGKKYKMPKETDDPDYHLDAGTTFMNAYKSLKPDQISAMTKDTQDLINTQKQLMSTLNTLKPLITDGKQMMDTFQGYFGAGATGGVTDLAQLAEKFAPKAE